MSSDLVVIGGGASGMMAALTGAMQGCSVTLLEPNAKLGRKLYISGKGRCNLTNHCTPQQVLQNVPRNSRFLYSAVTRFPPAQVMEFFEGLGVPLKTERGGRVFPQSDKAADVIDALLRALRRSRVSIVQDRALRIEQKDGAVTGVVTQQGRIECKAVVLCTGGLSYPLTGSTGDGYAMARALGHTITPLEPSLVGLNAAGEECSRMQGLTLKNVGLKVRTEDGKIIYQEQGELLFTHFGLSGPMILSASAHLRDYKNQRCFADIDLKPALDEEKLDARLLRDFEAHGNRAFQTVLEDLLPRLMVPVMVERSGIPAQTKVHSITRVQRRSLLTLLKSFRVELAGPRPIAEAIVTSGGVCVNEINPRTMSSKKVAGLYFAGEIIDVDAYTGGYNLQIAWCTGKAAGEGAAQYCKGDKRNEI